MEKIIVYTMPNCFRCKNLKTLLERKNLHYSEVTDVDVMEQKGINHVPVMAVNGQLMDYDRAVLWTGNLSIKEDNE